MTTDTAPHHQIAPGMAQAVAERTFLRQIPKQDIELPPILPTYPKDPDRGHVVRICQERRLTFSFEPEQQIRFGEYLRWETWAEVANRVACGNASLDPRIDWDRKDTNEGWAANPGTFAEEFDRLNHHLKQASLLMSGRHLQHGDERQRFRNMEVS